MILNSFAASFLSLLPKELYMKHLMYSLSVLAILLVFVSAISSVFAQGKLSSRVAMASGHEDQLLVWITFKDKGTLAAKYSEATRNVSPRAIQRRSKMMPLDKLIDDKDYPVESSYITQVERTGVTIRQQSRWFNAVSAQVSKEQLRELEKLNCVANIDLVMRLKKSANDIEFKSSGDKSSTVTGKSTGIETIDYGTSFTQNNQISVPAVHNLGIYGQGVMIAVFDAGFNNLGHEAFDSMNIVATHDFVNGDSSVADDPGQMGEGSHGTNTLSVCGGYKPGQLVGPSFRASYVLAKTENTESETPLEEDNWIAAIEWAEGYGVDIISSSLGYIGMDAGSAYSYDWTWMNGDSCKITKAADMATWRGVVVVNSAGNEYDDPSHNTLGAPADGDTVIAVGAVYSDGSRVGFSSVGPTVDGRIKPDVMAMGSGVKAAYGSPGATGYENVDGTSFSCPLTAGVCGLILSANPNLTPYQVREALRNTASQSGSPDKYFGWGIANALNAVNYYRAVIIHTPMTDTEDLTGPYPINATITSTMAIDSVVLVYGTDGSFDQTVNMSHTGNNYFANIPGTGVPTNYNYYIKVKNTMGLISYEPKNAPAVYHSFTASADTVKPVITHTPIPAAVIYFLPVQITATITDNIGIDSVWVEYEINHAPFSSFPMTTSGGNIFNGSFNFSEGQVTAGDTVSYRIWARDLSSNQNVKTSPDESSFFHFPITTDTGYVTVFYDDFTSGAGNWTIANNGGTCLWEIQGPSYPNEYTLPVTSSGNVMAADADDCGSGGSLLSDLILTTGVDVSFDSVRLEFDSDWNNYVSSDTAIVYVSAGAGIWHRILTYSADFRNTHVKLDVTSQLRGSNQAKVRFRSIQPGYDWWWAIDNVKLSVRGPRVLDANIYQNTPKIFALEQNYPNPFNPATTIRYQIPASEKVSLKIYNTLGQEVRTLVNAKQNAGAYSIQWDGKDTQGRAVSSGIYIYRLKAGSNVKSQKMMLIR